MKIFKKAHYLLGTSALAVMLSLNNAQALEDTLAGRELVRQGYKGGSVSEINLNRQARLATLSLNGNTSTDAITTLPAAISDVQACIGVSTKVTDDLKDLIAALNGTVDVSTTNLSDEINNLWGRLSGATGNSIGEDLTSVHGLLDGVKR